MEVGIARAKDSFSELIERAERGEVVTITRHGKAVVTVQAARTRPTPEQVEQVFRGLSEHRGQMPKLTDDQIVELVREGRRG